VVRITGGAEIVMLNGVWRVAKVAKVWSFALSILSLVVLFKLGV
jgi:hypothetical protein